MQYYNFVDKEEKHEEIISFNWNLCSLVFGFIFLLSCRQKDIITTTENEYTFQLSKYITNTHLEKLAQKSDVTIQLKEFQNVSLGHTKMTITF